MPDLFPDRAADRGADRLLGDHTLAAPAEPAFALRPEAEHSLYAPVFAKAFDMAYDTPGDPRRGERVLADVRAEARTFGDAWTVQSVAAERFGAAAQPEANALLARALPGHPGQEVVLNAHKAGPATPGRGDDLVVLLDREGAYGAGHVAILIGDDTTGWRLYSKDGSAGSNPISGPTTWTNGDGTDQSIGDRFAKFDTLDTFFRDAEVSDRFEAAVRVETPGDASVRGDRARDAAERILAELYHVTRSSCAHVVVAALEGAGVPGFALTRSRTVVGRGGESHETAPEREAVFPRDLLRDVREADTILDRESNAQKAWSARTSWSEHRGDE